MKKFIYNNHQVQLITKRSDGQCLVMRKRVSAHNGQTYIRRFWVHKDRLEKLPTPNKPEVKVKPGIKATKINPRLLKEQSDTHNEKEKLGVE